MGIKQYTLWGIIIIAAIVIILTALAGAVTVPTGMVGIKLEWNNAIGQVGPGLHIIMPYIQSMVNMDTKVQKIDAKAAAATRDLQNVQVDIAVNYRLDPAKTLDLFRQVGLDYNNRITTPSVQEVVKQVTAKFKAQELITMREDVRNQIQDVLTQRLNPFGIVVTQVSITNIDFSPEFDAAIERTAEATQREQLANAELRVTQVNAQTQIVQAEAAKNATIAQAEGIQEATVLKAQGDSEAIMLISSTLLNNTQYINYLETLKWNGQLPLFGMGPSGGGGGMDMIFTPEILNWINSTSASNSNSTIGDLPAITLPSLSTPTVKPPQGGVVINSK